MPEDTSQSDQNKEQPLSYLPEETEAEEEETEDQAESEDDSEEVQDDKEELENEWKPDSDEDDGDADDSPPSSMDLDDEILSRMSDEDREIVQKRWGEQVKGLDKLKSRYEGAQEELAKSKKSADRWDSLNEGLGTKDNALNILKELQKGIEKQYGVTASEAFGIKPEATGTDVEEPTEFEYDGERRLNERMKLLDKKLDELGEKMGSDDVKEWVTSRRQEEQLTDRARREASGVVEKVGRATGYKLKDAQVVEAIKKYPNMDPAEAAEFMYRREILDFTAKKATRAKKKAKTIAKASTSMPRKKASIHDAPGNWLSQD